MKNPVKYLAIIIITIIACDHKSEIKNDRQIDGLKDEVVFVELIQQNHITYAATYSDSGMTEETPEEVC